MRAASNGSGLPYRGVLGHWKRPKPRIVAKKSARALHARGARDATIVTTINLDRLQVHRKWEMSDYSENQTLTDAIARGAYCDILRRLRTG